MGNADVFYLTVEDVLDINQQICEWSGNLADHDLLDRICGEPARQVGGIDLVPSLAGKAAVLVIGIVGDCPFLQFNEAIGMQAAQHFLWINGYVLRLVPAGERIGLARKVADHQIAVHEVQAWFEYWLENA